MNKALILRITGGVAALVGLLGFGHFLAFPQFSDSINYLLVDRPEVAFGLISTWLITPSLLAVVGTLIAALPNRLQLKISAIALIVVSSLHAFMWLAVVVIRNNYSFEYLSFNQFFETISYQTGELDSARLLAAIATPFSLVVLGAAIWLLVTAPKQVKEFDISQPPARKTPSGFTQFLATLVDAKLENFISRRVSGVLYIITAWLIIAAAALSELGLLFQLFSGNFFAFVAMLLVPVITLLTLIIVRMAFEAGIALIVIAENTRK